MSGELCQLASDWDGTVPEGGFMVDEKIDGWRAIYFPGRDGIWRLWTRNGMRLEGVDHILHRLAMLNQLGPQAYMLDGEIQVDGTLEATKAWFEKGWRTGGNRGVLHLFDICPIDAWRAGGWHKPQVERKELLKSLIADIPNDWEWREGSRGADERDCVRFLPDQWLLDQADVYAEVQRVWDAGGEGLMIKDAEAPYWRERNRYWQKCKLLNWKKWIR